MSEYSEFFLNTPSRVVQLELLEISHPNFSKVYRIVRNNRLGCTVTLEDGITTVFFEYYPVKITRSNTDNSLDQVYKIQLGDLGELIPKELDLVSAADGFLVKPQVRYRTYRSDDLSKPLLGPMDLEIVDMPMTREGASFEAQAPSLNNTQTGEVYDFDRFPGLRGFL